MQHVSVLNHDKLSQESADMIGQLMPIIDSINTSTGEPVSECGSAALKCLQLNVPYLGTINIHPSTTEGAHASNNVTPGAMPTAPLGLYNPSVIQTPSSPPQPFADSATTTLPDAPGFSPIDSSLATGVNGMFMEFEPQNQSQGLNFPNLTAEAEDWAFQGVDTTYWSLLNSINFGGSTS